MFLKNKNIIFKIRRSKVTDYAALKWCVEILLNSCQVCLCIIVFIEAKGGNYCQYNEERCTTNESLPDS